MSDLAVGTARIIVRPDTTQFRAQLVAQVQAASRGVTVPVQVTPVTTGAGLAQVTAQTQAATQARRALAEQERLGAQAARDAATADKERARTLRQVQTATAAQAAAITGLRGAVLTAGTAFLAATVGIQVFGRAVSSAAQLESDLNVFRVTAGATAEEMALVREEARLLGRDIALPGVAATDAAQTFLTLSRAGLDVQDALAGARGTLQLATAAQIEFAEAAQLTASALNAFQLSGDEAITVADLLTNAANASQASITEMGIALRQSSAIAAQVGFSVSETVTFLTQLAQAGLAGSDAGTSFRVAMQRLIAPTGKAREAIERLNLNLRDASGDLRPEVFFELGDALERMSRAQADATRQIIFGNDASRAAAFFARLNADAFREQEQNLNRQGAAAEVAGARTDGFAGSVENLKNQATSLGIVLGELALPALGGAADVTAAFFGTLADQITASKDALLSFNDDAEKLGVALRQVSDDSGFTDFVTDVAEGGRLIAGDIQRASDATDNFFASLLGIGGSAEQATVPVKELSEEERRLAESIFEAVRPTVEQTTGLNELAQAAARAAQAIRSLQGQQLALEEQATRARIAGDEDAEIQALVARREALEAELARQEAIIARPGTAGEATAREAIRQRILPQLEAVNNEILNIQAEQRSRAQQIVDERNRAAEDAARAQAEADRNFIDALASRREDANRRAGAAADTASLNDDIRAQDRIQALIKIQIQKIRDQIKDEQTRRNAIRELRIALIESRREEEALRQERAQAAAAARQEAINLDIEFAEITGNTAREIAARQRLIALLRKQQAAVKKGTAEWKRLRNEIAQQQQAIKDARGEAEQDADQGKSAQQFFFEQLQAQQGFASNLLGNLITGPTEGLVGVPSPPGRTISLAARVQEGRQAGGPTAGQANVTNDILLRILQQLKLFNGATATPEADNNRRSSSAVMDGVGGGSGSASVM